jgi:dipeptidyl aminopeptidase/acylaminoacyl peptidase
VPADLEEIRELTDVQLAGARARVAVVETAMSLVTNAYRRTVLWADVDGEGVTELRAVAAADGPRSQMLPRWSPDGSWLAFAELGGQGSSGIRLWRPGSGESRVVTEGWAEPIEELAWSPDGGRLVFVCRQPVDPGWYASSRDRRPPRRVKALQYQEDHVGWVADRPHQGYVVGVGGGEEPRRLSTGWYDDTHFAWAPDGRSLAFVSRRHPGRDLDCLSDVFTVTLDDPQRPRQLTGTTRTFARPVFRPDGRELACLVMDGSRFPARWDLGVLEPSDGGVTVLTGGLDRDCNPASVGMPAPVWLDEEELVVLAEDAGAVHAYTVARNGRKPRLTLGGHRRFTSISAQGELMAVVTSSPSQPPEVGVVRAGQEVGHSRLNRLWAARRDLRDAEHVEVPARDGTRLDAWVVRPSPGLHTGPYPVLVSLQGGGTQYGYQFSHEVQVQAGAGFAVVYLNPRGSAGYGEAWARMVCGPKSAVGGRGWGGYDVEDVATAVQVVTTGSPDLDQARVGVLGGSYGALLVTWLLATTKLFRAGWAERGPYDLYSLAGTNDESSWFFRSYLGVSQVEDPEEYWARSPLRLVEGITAPLMIVHSEEDLRCPIQQAEELFTALRFLGRHVELVRFPGECHELSRSGSPVHRLQRMELMMEWFKRWL